jgi:glutamine synthetase
MAVTADEILDLALTSATRLVRFLYCDTSSIVRGKTTHIDRLKDRLSSGIGLVKGQMSMNLLDQLQTDTGFGAVGEVRLVPDLSTFVLLPYAPQSAAVICDMYELDHRPWSLCPRNILKRQIEKAEQSGIYFQAAFEPEFMIGSQESGEFVPIDTGLCFSTESMNRAASFVMNFIYALERQGIEIEQYYAELGHGQHELSIGHAPVLRAADRHLWYRETLRGVAQEQGVRATLAPKPFADQPGNGCHLHLSAWDRASDTNLFSAAGGQLSELGRHFVAGLLKHLPALIAITCPSVNSYRRLQPRAWSSAFVCWGYENREAAVRVPSVYWGREAESTNLEIKCVDSSCNPYLALAAVLACGLDGIENKLVPPEPVDSDPSALSEERAEAHGVRRFPLTLKDALLELENDDLLKETLGETMTRTFLVVKYSECAAFAGGDAQLELAQHRYKF